MTDNDMRIILQLLSTNPDKKFPRNEIWEVLRNELLVHPDILAGRINNEICMNGWAEQNQENNEYVFNITPVGINKLNLLIEQKEKQDKLDKQINDVNDSVIKTNTITQSNIKRNDKLFWLTLGIAALGVIIQAMQYKRDNRIINLEKQLQLKDSTIKQIQMLQSQIKNPVVYPSVQEPDSSNKK